MSFRGLSLLALFGVLASAAVPLSRAAHAVGGEGTRLVAESAPRPAPQHTRLRVGDAPRRATIESPSDPLSAPRCPNVSVSIVIELEDHDESSATLRGPDEGRGRLRKFKSRVGRERVVYVGTHPRTGRPTVWLTEGTGLCQVGLGDLPRSGHAAGAGRGLPRSAPPSPRGVDAVVARIWRKDSGETRIERSAVDDVLANPVALLRGVRLDPSAGPGIGLRGIRPGSVLHALGLVEGDRLLSINGQPLLGVEEGLAAYARLRTADVLHLEVQREGGTIELTVGVR